MDTIQALLLQYAQAQNDQMHFQAACDRQKAEVMALIPPHILHGLTLVEEERANGTEELNKRLNALAEAIKAEVLRACHTVKCHGYTAIFTPGRAVWDDGFLQGYAAVHEEILQGRREGKPSVSLRKDK